MEVFEVERSDRRRAQSFLSIDTLEFDRIAWTSNQYLFAGLISSSDWEHNVHFSLSLSFEIYSGRVEGGIDLPAKRHLENSVKSLSTDSKEGSWNMIQPTEGCLSALSPSAARH